MSMFISCYKVLTNCNKINKCWILFQGNIINLFNWILLRPLILNSWSLWDREKGKSLSIEIRRRLLSWCMMLISQILMIGIWSTRTTIVIQMFKNQFLTIHHTTIKAYPVQVLLIWLIRGEDLYVISLWISRWHPNLNGGILRASKTLWGLISRLMSLLIRWKNFKF